jgi:hypothetical protein
MLKPPIVFTYTHTIYIYTHIHIDRQTDTAINHWACKQGHTRTMYTEVDSHRHLVCVCVCVCVCVPN